MAEVYNDNMTVILAGLCDDGKGAVLVADRMRTVGHPFFEKEIRVENEDITKISRVNENVYIAFSGTQNFWQEIMESVSKKIHPKDKPNKVRKIIEKAYQKQHQAQLEARVLVPLGFESFTDYNSQVNKTLSPARIAQIDDQLKNFVGEGELVLIACDDNQYSIWGLNDPGFFKLNSYGEVVSGSGTRYGARLVIENHKSSMSQEEVKNLLLEAKKLAEQDPGVGTMTQIICLPEL